jgi:hypothetical protein
MCHAAQYAKMVLALAAGGGGRAGAEGGTPAAVCETSGLDYTLFIACCLSSQLTVGREDCGLRALRACVP